MTESDNRKQDAVEQYAESLGITPDELFEELDEVQVSEETETDCLRPEDVRLHSIGQLSWSRQTHLMECADCRALVAASQPTEARVQEFLKEVEAEVRSSGR